MGETTIITCDVCEREGVVREAAHRVRLSDLITRRTGRIDLCAEHGDTLFGSSSRREASGRRSNGQRTRLEITLRCPLPGNDGYEGPGQGMFQHYRHAHPDTKYDAEQREAAKAAYDAAHRSKRGRRAAA